MDALTWLLTVVRQSFLVVKSEVLLPFDTDVDDVVPYPAVSLIVLKSLPDEMTRNPLVLMPIAVAVTTAVFLRRKMLQGQG